MSRRRRDSVAAVRSARETEALMGLARLLNQQLDVMSICQQIVELVLTLLPIKFSAITLLDPDGSLRVVARQGDPILAGGAVVLPRGVGVTGQAVLQEQPCWSADVRNDPRYLWPDDIRHRILAGGQRAVLAVPLRPRGRTIGALVVADCHVREFSDSEVRLVQAFADDAAIALEKAQLYEEAEHRRREAEQLVEAARTMTAALDVTTVAGHIAQSLVAQLGAGWAVVARLDRDGSLTVLASAGAAGVRVPSGTRFPPGNGLPERAMREGRPCWSPDVLTDPALDLSEPRRRFAMTTTLRGVLAVPLAVGGRAIGMVSVGFEAGRSVSERDVAVARALADHAALALDNATLYDEAQQQRREAETLAEIARTINASLDLDIILHRVVEGARDLCGSDLAGIALCEPGTERAVFRHAPGARQDWRGVGIDPGQGAGGIVLRTGRPFKTDSYLADPRITSEYAGLCAVEGIVAQAVVPIRHAGRIEGLLYLNNRSARPFTDHDLEILARLADQAAIAIRNAQHFAERNESETALRSSERQYRLLAEHMADVVTLFDMNLRQTYVSPSVLRLRGYTAEEAMAQALDERMTPASVELMARLLSEELAIEASGQGDPARARTLELELRRRDGSTVWAETTATFVRDEAGRPAGIIAVSRNVTDRKRAEAALRESELQLRQAQKMEAIGQLAGGIAHDFNNLLTVIRGRGQLLEDRLAPGDPARLDLDVITSAADRAAALTRQLLAFSRRQMLQPKVFILNGAVTGVSQMLTRLIGEHIRLLTRLAPDLGAVRADPTQIEQIILNLAVNARDAMPAGGCLSIETANVDIDAAFAAANPGSVPGPYVCLQVSDTGEGMSTDVQAHIFEPFYTTKEVGKGTGLGLATVYGIVKQHDGYIAVESAPGAGTTFRVFLRRVEEPLTPSPGTRAARMPSGSETVLVVEDEVGVCELAREILAGAGYTVLAAVSPDAALDIAERHDGPIHLLLTDVVMPIMNGRALAERLAERRPGLRVLYMSGYTDDAIVHRGRLDADTVLLAKPFTPHALSRKVREVLDRAPVA